MTSKKTARKERFFCYNNKRLIYFIVWDNQKLLNLDVMHEQVSLCQLVLREEVEADTLLSISPSLVEPVEFWGIKF